MHQSVQLTQQILPSNFLYFWSWMKISEFALTLTLWFNSGRSWSRTVSQPFFHGRTPKINFIILSMKKFTYQKKLIVGSTIQLLLNYCHGNIFVKSCYIQKSPYNVRKNNCCIFPVFWRIYGIFSGTSKFKMFLSSPRLLVEPLLIFHGALVFHGTLVGKHWFRSYVI
jgi:hypothetical protein